MNIINLFFFFIFISHGFCDFLPLLKTLDINILYNYILLIFVIWYLHLLCPSISTLIFLVLSSIHFSQDFKPFHKPVYPGIGFYILGIPALFDYYTYRDVLNYIEITNIDLFILIMLVGGVLGAYSYYNKYDYSFFIVTYFILSMIFGLHAVIIYMLYYHLPLAVCILCDFYNMKLVLNILLYSTLSISIVYFFTYEYLQLILNTYKNHIIGTIFGVLNSHSLTNIIWKYNKRSLRLL